ncbi:GntR family transcriptional regulator [Roseobacter sp. YSTF-M11]|uniref:GntR family transcriptional regulator n=1 Tax=Roseobacter insulae TaxID=2859783 RepID=A0A9X1K226_9RHOB|nr:GntR family transcriptional regulator [Roseobacter insulae]MBW4709814.1 GntR family transcriptional regulator [Roseobacter insulae]
MNERLSSKATCAPVTITEDVYARLRADILSGALFPGEKLKVADLCRRYDVGASPLREALSRLSSENLTDKTENRGFRVASISEAQYREVFELRCLLEADALQKSIRNGARDWEDRLTVAFFRLDRVPVGAPDWEELHRTFHVELLSEAGSILLLRYIEELYDQAVRYRNLSRAISDDKRDVRGEHKAVFEAAIARDMDAATAALMGHYQHTLQGLRSDS